MNFTQKCYFLFKFFKKTDIIVQQITQKIFIVIFIYTKLQ